jgi:hypothetical protein
MSIVSMTSFHHSSYFIIRVTSASPQWQAKSEAAGASARAPALPPLSYSLLAG